MKSLVLFILLTLFNILAVPAAPVTGLQFNGTSTSYIDCGSKPEFSPTQFTIEAWVNYQTLNDGYIISTEGWGTGAEGFKIHTFGSKFEFAIGATSTWTSVVSKADVVANTWYHIAVTYTAATMNIYINGILDNTLTNPGTPMIASSQHLSIGEGSMWKGREMTGKLSDVRFWNVVRTPAEIAAAMNSSLTGTETGLIANWKMNEGTGTSVADATGNYPLTIISSVAWFTPTTQGPIRVVCVGNSITAGIGASDGAHAYPAQLGNLLGNKYLVLNCGVSGRTLLKKGDFPYWNEKKYADAKNFDPQIVLIALGTNDSKSFNWLYKSEFYTDYATMINEFRSGGKNPHIFVCFPPPAFIDNYSITNSVIYHEILPLVDSIRTTLGTSCIDYYHPLLPYGGNFPDGIHPNDAGALFMAQIAFKAITKNLTVTSLKSPVSSTTLSGAEQLTITINNNKALPLVNVPVAYKIDGNNEVKEVIGSIPANTEINYTFTQKADLSQVKDYSILIYTAVDTAKTNDTLTLKVTKYLPAINRALLLSGSNGEVVIPHTAALMPLTAFTIEAWIYPTKFRTNIYEGTVISKESSNGSGYALNVGGDGQARIVIGNPNWVEAVIPAKSIGLNQWSHIAGVYDGASLKFYVNGILKVTTLNAGTIKASPSPVYIGASSAFGGRGFIGGIDEVSIWKIALAETEINYRKDYFLKSSEDGLVAYYHLNQTPGNELISDTTQNVYNGTLQNIDLFHGWMPGVELAHNLNTDVVQTKVIKGVTVFTDADRNYLIIKLSEKQNHLTLQISDLSGRQMLKRDLKDAGTDIKLDVRNYNQGIYIVTLHSDSGKTSIKINL